MRGITIRRFLRVKTCVQHEKHVKTVSKCMPEEKSVCRRPQAMRRIKNYLFFAVFYVSKRVCSMKSTQKLCKSACLRLLSYVGYTGRRNVCAQKNGFEARMPRRAWGASGMHFCTVFTCFSCRTHVLTRKKRHLRPPKLCAAYGSSFFTSENARAQGSSREPL